MGISGKAVVTAGDTYEMELFEDAGVVEVVDRALGTWILRLEPAPIEVSPDKAGSLALGTAVVGSLVRELPALRQALDAIGKSAQGLRVVFSPEVQKGLRDGSYRLMTGAKTMPVAVNGAGRFVEIGAVAPPGSAAAGLGAAGGPGTGTLGTGVALGAAWPIVLAAAVAAAAAYAEHRWLQEKLSELQTSVSRIEWRMRDDDFGVLEAATRLIHLLGAPAGEAFAVPEYHKMQLAVAQQQVESIYLSRRRFVARLKEEIEERQIRHEEKKGERRGWAKGVSDKLEPGKGASAELVVFIAAMIARAKTTTASAAVLVGDGEPIRALRMIRDLHESLRADYYDLYRRLRALALHGPEAPKWKRVVPMFDEDDRAAHGFVTDLVAEMERTVGAALPEMDEPLALPVSAAEAIDHAGAPARQAQASDVAGGGW